VPTAAGKAAADLDLDLDLEASRRRFAVTGDVFALLAGGGTGGHTYPAVALAEALVARGHAASSLRFVGGKRGPEGGIVADAGFAIDLLPGRGLQRRLTLANLGVLWESIVAFVRAIALVRRYRPAVVVGFGGYASLPCLVGAWVWRVPRVVHEQDAAPGLANRIGVRLGAQPAVSLPGTPLPGAVLTGNPVRQAFRSLARTPQTEPTLVAMFGGALGARTINDAALGLYDRWRHRRDVAVHHVTGPRNEEQCAKALADRRRPDDALDYALVPYEARMDELFGRTSVAVCRAGAGTIAELTAAGLPAVLVPLPGAPSDHQMRNARTLEAAGAVVVLPDPECTAERLDPMLSGLLADPARLAAMAQASRALSRPEAADALADLVEARARG
jgi:UDP-N-acetylglucosamine--N-acetylmuramyl-(pentapeptide) pyrophosphoryl-undecaprenol N-acetylglucosamine transferase